MTYEELTRKHQQEVNNFPFVFAFNDRQFEKAAAEKWGTFSLSDVISIGAGGYILRKDRDRMHAMFQRFHDELREQIDADQTGRGFIEDMFYYELANHEYCITGDVSDALGALGITPEEVNSDPRLKEGLKAAAYRAAQIE